MAGVGRSASSSSGVGGSGGASGSGVARLPTPYGVESVAEKQEKLRLSSSPLRIQASGFKRRLSKISLSRVLLLIPLCN